MKKIKYYILLSVSCLFLINCHRIYKPNSMSIIGSDTMVNLVAAWAEEFIKIHPDYFVAVTGGGSGTGIASMISGACDIASTSREIKKKEIEIAKKNNINIIEKIVGLDGIAVIVHPTNPVEKLTIDQLSDIFTGKITNWKLLGGKDAEILLLSREVNSGTHIYFKEKILRKGKKEGREEFSPSALLLSSSQAIADEITNNPQAIGYYGMGYINNKQKVLKIAKDNQSEYFEPTNSNVISGKYPISRPLFLYIKDEHKEIVKKFIDFVLSDKGQEIVKLIDFVPIR